jgi:hypothetical protein|tara:strand:+ start:99 stop:200 length:102 start_codon:yes stop_codon:yes gene_type:complete
MLSDWIILGIAFAVLIFIMWQAWAFNKDINNDE